jgi:parallel beta-helix repeat protein
MSLTKVTYSMIKGAATNVQDFGAVGDGTTNDTAAIQAAINSLANGGTLFFPNGEYKLTSSLTVTTDNILLQGDLNARIKRYGAIEIFNITGSYNKISNLQLMGNKTSYPYPAFARAAIVIVQGDFNNIIENQIEDGNSHGILFRTGGAAQFNLAQGNIVLNCDEVGISHDGGVDNRILGNHVSGCGFEGITLDHSSFRCIVDSNRLNNNCIDGGVGGIGVDFTDLCVISNNVITASGALSGITFQNNIGPSNYNVISGNVFDENDQYGVWLKNGTGGASSDNVISGNVFRASGSIKIDNNCQRNILSGNSYSAFPDVNTDSYCRVDNALVNFYVENSITRSNVTGDGTVYVVPFNILVQDRNITSTSSFNLTTGIFTSPITANYTFSAGVEVTTGTTTGNSVLLELVTTAGTFSNVYEATGEDVFGGTVSASFFLKRGETAQVRVTVTGGSKNFSVTNNVNANFFTGVLIG